MANNDNLDPKDLNKAPEEEIDTSTGTAEDVEAVMKKYDRESNVRRWEGTPGLVVKSLSALFSLYCIYVTLFSTAMPEIRLNIFLALILILGYLHYPIHKGVRDRQPADRRSCRSASHRCPQSPCGSSSQP